MANNNATSNGMSPMGSSASAPLTQAVGGQIPTLSQSGASIEPMPTVVVSNASTQEQQQQQQQQQQARPGPSTPYAASLASGQQGPVPSASTSTQHDAPSQAAAPAPVILTGFAAVQSIAAAKPNPVPYTKPPPYDPIAPGTTSNLPPPTGIVGESAPRQLVSDAEVAKMDSDQLRDLQRKGKGVLREHDIRAMSIEQLRKLGVGRTPSGYCYSGRMTLHTELNRDPKGDTHPEQPARIAGIFQKLKNSGLAARMERVAVREAVRDEVMLVHSEGHWDRVRALGFQTVEYLQSCSEYFERLSLYANPETSVSARLSCGGVIEMCRAVAEGQIRNGFAIVRPPGHHAEPEDAMGFCFFNNVAVAAKWLRTVYDGTTLGASGQPVKKMERILILDWDVHHGNGTQKAFWGDKDILYMSLHRHGDGFYPGGTYGGADMVGQGPGEGYSVNVPFPDTGMSDADYIYAFQRVIMPIAYEFNPDIVLVSAGYDAAEGDTLGLMKVTPAGFAHMTHMLSVLANGKLVLALEGGYNVDSIVKSAHACVEVLVGDEPRPLQLGPASMSATNAVQNVIGVQSKYWKSMGYSIEPSEELLKSHRVYDLYHEYGLFNVELVDPLLEEKFSNQLLCSGNVYDADTLLLFMHDIGSIKASFMAATLDVDLEKTLLLDTSRAVLDWATKENNWGVIDVNMLAHIPSVKGQAPDKMRDQKLERDLALFVWDNIARRVELMSWVHICHVADVGPARTTRLSEAKHIVLFASGVGYHAMMALISQRADIRERVRAVVAVLGHEAPPELDAASGARTWYKERSYVILPSSHPLHEDARKAGKHQKRFGNVHRSTADDESRPVHLIKSFMPRIKEFVGAKVPTMTVPARDSNGQNGFANGVAVDGQGDVAMASGQT
ncbi:Histone deacetylase hda1 [Microbotryomycetes sp. JL201]|nr:Histone deacetylase hda1 [Microbotryomycetes sp. JL201]